MILVDTAVWIDYLNGSPTEYTDELDACLIKGTVVIGDLIFLEILQGFRNDREYGLAKKTLSTLEQYQMFNSSMALKSASNYRKLRKSGITIRSTIDVIIATFCIENKIPLLFSDKDFRPFVNKLGLKSAM